MIQTVEQACEVKILADKREYESINNVVERVLDNNKI